MKTFECKRCGSCCKGESTVSLTFEEINRIANFLGLTQENFIKKYTTSKGKNRIEMKTSEGFCIFYDKNSGLCKIHPVKPKKCKEWPFPPIIFNDLDNFKIIQSSCKGLMDLSFEDIKKQKLDKKENCS